MKTLVFCVCILTCVFFISARDLRAHLYSALSVPVDDHKACRAKVGVTNETIFEENDIINDVHFQPGMEERRTINGCFVMCNLRKADMMDGSEIKEQKIQSEITFRMGGFPVEAKAHEIIHDCVLQAKDITPECEKGFKLMECIIKAVHESSKKPEGHDEHEVQT